MKPTTRSLWDEQNRHTGDRERLFTVVADHVGTGPVLYPGSFVDLGASFAFDDVTYVDNDKRAAKFFADEEGVREIIGEERADHQINFIAGDYRKDLGLEQESFNLLVSLYAGIVSEPCGKYVEIGGWLLVNGSHGDATMSTLDERFELAAVVISRAGSYKVDATNLERFLIPKKQAETTREEIHERQRGLTYTASPFAYLFERMA